MTRFEQSSERGGIPGRASSVPRDYRVLLAEDEEAMRTLLVGQLRRAGYAVDLAEDGLHLITHLDWSAGAAAPRPFDALVSDLRMPGADGMRILQWLRAQGSRMPVVLITAFGTRELHAEADRLGAALIDKPFEIAQLLAVLRDTIEQYAGRKPCGDRPEVPKCHEPATAEPYDASAATIKGNVSSADESSTQEATGCAEAEQVKAGSERPGHTPIPQRT